MKTILTSASAGWGVALAVLTFSAHAAAVRTVDFDDLTLAPESYWRGPDPDGVDGPGPWDDVVCTGAFTSGGVRFVNRYSRTYASWSGFAYSNTTDTTTPGHLNQYSAYTGSGTGPGSDIYGVAYGYVDYLTPQDPDLLTWLVELPFFELPDGHAIQGAYVTNTTYAALSMRHGDDFARPFGHSWDGGAWVDTGEPDWFLLTAYGTDAAGNVLMESPGVALHVEFYLADYRFDDNGLDYVVDSWQWLDLGLLADARTLYFNLSSSDVGMWGMNTPACFAIDGILLDAIAGPTLTWAGGAGFWDDANWDDGAGLVSPTGGESFVVVDGAVIVDDTFTAELAAASLRIEGESAGVHVAPLAALEVQAAVDVSDGAALIVDGLLDAGVLTIHGDDPQSGAAAATLSGGGTIRADLVVIGGVLSPGSWSATAGSSGSAESTAGQDHRGASAHSVPEPAAATLLLAAALLLVAGGWRRNPPHRRGA